LMAHIDSVDPNQIASDSCRSNLIWVSKITCVLAQDNMRIDNSKILFSSPNRIVTTHWNRPFKTILSSGNSIEFGEEM